MGVGLKLYATAFSASYLLLNTIQANDVAFKGLVYELHCADNVETGLRERADRIQIAHGWISDDSTQVAVGENVVRSELSNNSRPQPATRHLDFSYREVDSGRPMVSTQS